MPRTQSTNNEGHVSISVHSPEGAGTNNCYPVKLKSYKSENNLERSYILPNNLEAYCYKGLEIFLLKLSECEGEKKEKKKSIF